MVFRYSPRLIELGLVLSILLAPVLGAAPAINSTDRLKRLATPLAFEPNVGQFDPAIRFVSRARGMTTWFSDRDVVMWLEKPGSAERVNPLAGTQREARRGTALRMKLIGSEGARGSEGLERMSGVYNYFLGDDPAYHRVGVPRYGRIVFHEVYPGIDLLCYVNAGMIEYDFLVAPGADPAQVRLTWEGADRIALNDQGDLVLSTSVGDVIQKRPRVFQDLPTGRVEIAANYLLTPSHEVAIAFADYDRSRPLVLDPPVYAQYLGGSHEDIAFGIAVNAAGEAFVVGNTNSSPSTGNAGFPNTFNPSLQVGTSDVFVTKYDSTGAIAYSTFFGGGANDVGLAIAVDSASNVYVTGTTNSTNFVPTSLFGSAFQNVHSNGPWDAFITKLSPLGVMLYSTYLGGGGTSEGHGIAVDSTGAIYVAGTAGSAQFPVKGNFQTNYGGGWADGFVSKLSPAGNALVYSFFLGGSDKDVATAIAVDGGANAYVVGYTDSSNFSPISAGAIQSTYAGIEDAFLAKVDPSGTSVIYSTFLGGAGSEQALGVAVDSTAAVYVVGRTNSRSFATTPTPPSPLYAYSGNIDAYICKLAPAGDKLIYFTYIGGAGDDFALAVAVNRSGEAYFGGWTNSSAFPQILPFQSGFGGADDGFVAKMSQAGNSLAYLRLIGGANYDHVQAIAVDVADAAYVAGYTYSSDFPTEPAGQPAWGSQDAFVMKIPNVSPLGGATMISPTPGMALTGTSVTFTWTAVPGATGYALGLGTSLNNNNIFQQQLGTVTSYTVNSVPANTGIWVQLATQINGNVVFNDYQYSAFHTGPKAVMTSPTPSTTLAGNTVTFSWLPANSASSYKLDVGTAVGLSDIYSKNVALATSQSVSGIPSNKGKIYVRLWTIRGTVNVYNDYTYAAPPLPFLPRPSPVPTIPPRR